MRKSLPMNNICDHINKSIIFEKTPKWRELFERTGSLIDVLKSYLKDTKPSIQFQELMHEKNIYAECRMELLKRSKTLSFSAVNLSKHKLTKSTSCIKDVYDLDDSVFESLEESKNESFKEIHGGKRNESFLQAIQMKRNRSYSVSLCEEASNEVTNFRQKRRLSANASLKDQFELSTDYTNCSSLSSVFEDSISLRSSRKSSSSPEKNEKDESQMKFLGKKETENEDADEDVVYLNDIYEDILSSQETKKIKNLDEKIDLESSSNSSSTFHHEKVPFIMDFSRPPPPIFQYLNMPNIYVNTYGYQASTYFWQKKFQQNTKQ